ncbi:LysM peptidoglycan-binding domain-containing protein [Aerococcus kribbianus]|uniref:LysM peptidoglycan-binding domain-containing protein n=1 Tax=Aerococcus kribbianus TaxID=2999064 RepID=A0A9X3FVE0_9LACT|nr:MULTISPECIES: LysM peptidoglycan-binding domain-containing protein [unclassified Aerococcus]MCZ0717656.1 LysM peptidoglycan-binding domain-containing protein [Aerococcus sp. YH-aer221]MCZ0725944.1 LysM peptidoglycan-binding domain-containing protein [Aerococcus sp. YH-aer222]
MKFKNPFNKKNKDKDPKNDLKNIEDKDTTKSWKLASDEEQDNVSSEDQSFDEYENLKNRKYSRSARNKKKTSANVTPLQKVLLFLAVLVILVPVLVYGYYSNQQKLPEKETAEQVMVSKTQNSSEEEASRKESESIAASKKAESESVAKAESESQAKEASSRQAEEDARLAQESQEQAAAQAESQRQAEQASIAQSQEAANQAAQESEAESQAESQASGTYTVQPGDNLYRIAVNHGMTLDELLELNGLSSSSSIGPGTVLQVN